MPRDEGKQICCTPQRQRQAKDALRLQSERLVNTVYRLLVGLLSALRVKFLCFRTAVTARNI